MNENANLQARGYCKTQGVKLEQFIATEKSDDANRASTESVTKKIKAYPNYIYKMLVTLNNKD